MPQFVPRQRKHKVRSRIDQDPNTGGDTNVVEIVQNETELRKKEYKNTVQTQKISSKKRKRLHKYIETKLRKEENLDLLKKLASTKIDTSLFQSSKNLGARKESKRTALTRALKDQQAGITSRGDQDLFESHGSSDASSDEIDIAGTSVLKQRLVEHDSLRPTLLSGPVGSGLKRPLDTDESGKPVVKKRQRLNKSLAKGSDEDESTWEGFGSTPDSLFGNDSDGTSLSDCTSNSEVGSSESSRAASADPGESNDLFIPTFPFEDKSIQHIPSRPTPRVKSDFKDWATQQINEARDFAPTRPLSDLQNSQDQSQKPGPTLEQRRPPENDPLPPELQVPQPMERRQAYSVPVTRLEHVQESRLKLPVVAEEQKIMEAIHNNTAVVVCGSTGSGKTTQIPQFLYEAGYGNPNGPTPGLIGVTQPRRVAAVTMARRVGEELNDVAASSYQIRFDSSMGKDTAIKFMTDGILIREIAQDFVLTKYSVIVIDEAHERSVNTDILIGMLSRIVDLRKEMSKANNDIKPLKLVIMSATLMVHAFKDNLNLFRNGAPPVVESEGRQFPVTMHFARRTHRDYVEEAFRKIKRGHQKLPPGAMLVFLTGQSEINVLAKRLKNALLKEDYAQAGPKVRIAARDAPLETEDIEIGEDRIVHDYSSDNNSGPSSDSDEDEGFNIEEMSNSPHGVLIRPLYSQLPTKEQLRVFEPPPENTRLVILATNVAETSITIPGVRYVFDCGRSKERHYDQSTGIQTYEIGWISKASAAQRAGRAGRTGPGHCYRLYSSAVYERDFPEHTHPEILRVPIEGVVLQLKSMDLQRVVNFPFPTPPEQQSILKAESLLSHLGALDKGGAITALGRDLTTYPLSPRFAKMMAIGHQQGCIYLTTAMVAALVVPDILIPENLLDLGQAESEGGITSFQDTVENERKDQQKREFNRARQSFSSQDSHSDALKTLSAFCAYVWASQHGDAEAFCARTFLHSKASKEAHQLYKQLLGLVALNRPGSVDPHKSDLAPPSKTQLAALKQIVAAGFLDQVAIRADLALVPQEAFRTPKRAIEVPYLTLFPSHEGKADILEESAVFIHPSSVLAHAAPKLLPQYLVYSHLKRATPATIAGIKVPKTRMLPLTPVSGSQLSALARGTPLLDYGKPIGKVESVEGERNKRIVWVVPSLVGGKGGRAWPLPAVKALQARNPKGEWVVEKIER